MTPDLTPVIDLIGGLTPWEMSCLLWLTLLVEAPRYFVGMHATAMAILVHPESAPKQIRFVPRTCVLLVGHNEESSLEKCVRSLRSQSVSGFEIACVDDGSTDRTFAIMRRLQQEGAVQTVAQLQLRGGKAAGINFAARLTSAEILVVVDCDCSFEPDAIEELLRPLVEDELVSAVSGNILVRNWRRSITTSMQAIEYLQSISLGKTFSNVIDQVSCASGAFAAFRRHAWDAVKGMDVGGGEDLDFTIRLRMAGHRIVFTRYAICYTDVPDTAYALIRQRNRWERDAFWIRLRKYPRIMNPFRGDFLWREAVHQLEFVLLNIVPTLVFPFYLIWLLTEFGEAAPILLLTVAVILFSLDVATFAAAVLLTGKPIYWRLLPFLPLYGVFQSCVMRPDRLYAYLSELVLSLSRGDNYVPQKVRNWSNWR